MALGLTPKEIIDSEKHPLLECSKEWERIELKEIADVQNGYAFKSEYFNHENGMPLIRIRDVGKSKAEELYSGEYEEDYLVTKGDILIGMDGDFRAAYWKGEPGLLNQRVCRVRNIDDSYSEKFLYYLLQPYLNAIHAETSAVTVKHLSSRTIQSIPLPNPPLPTQHRIVEKIEELFSELDNGVENLKKAQKQLKTYRQAVLKDAFEGKLTKEWREQQDDLLTPDQLLDQIKAERKAHRQQELAKWEKEVEQWENEGKPGRKPRKPRKPAEYEGISQKEFNKFNDILNYWALVRLGQISDSKGGHAFKSKNFSDSGKYQVLRIGNIRPNRIRFDESPVYIDNIEEKTLDKALLEKGDVVITLTGTRKKRDYGYAALITGENLLLNQRIAYLRFYTTIEPKFFLYFTQTRVFQNQFFSNETGNVGQGNVSMSAVTESVLPAPSLPEQRQIIEEIESRSSIIDQLEQTIQENLQKAEALRQSILKKAFSGELV